MDIFVCDSGETTNAASAKVPAVQAKAAGLHSSIQEEHPGWIYALL